MVKFHAPGDWPTGRVTQAWVPDGRRRVAAVEAGIDAAWAAAAARPGVRLFNGPMCRLESWHATADALRLTLSPTSYKPFVGTNMAHPEWVDEHGPDVMANPVGVSTVLVTADGWALLGRRNAAVAYYPRRVHPFAGALEPTDPDVFAAVRRELHEELSLNDADLADLRCTGVAEDVSLRQPELTFAAVARVARLDVESRLDPDEHAGVWAVPAEADAVAAAVDSDRDLLTPVGAAALLLWGRLRFGDDWFDRASRSVRSANRP